jgi:ribose 5-phosphate isomerase A
MATPDSEKRRAAQAALELVQDGMTLGLGTGSTATHFVELLAERMRQGLKVRGIPTSDKTRQLAQRLGVPLITFDDTTTLDLAIDGADEVDASFQIIKGGGGALLRERIVASASKLFVVLADASKKVPVLGAFPLPVEVVPMAWPLLAKRLEALGCRPTLRRSPKGEPTPTDEGHYILDCAFGRIEQPAALATEISALPGVVDVGLFINYPDIVIFGVGDAVERHDIVRIGPRRSP